jgi:hypothetical protein
VVPFLRWSRQERFLCPAFQQGERNGRKKYVVEVQTGRRDEAGTDAKVYIQLIGGLRDSPEIRLDNAEDNFEKGKLDRFEIMTEDVGWIGYVQIRHDDSRRNSGWFLEWVKVTDNTLGLTWQINFHRWLAKDEDDHKTKATKPVTLGGVTTERGLIRQIYLGYETRRKMNEGPQPIHFKETFTQVYDSTTTVELSKAISATTSAKLGGAFGKLTGEFSAQVAAQVNEKQTWQERTTLEWSDEQSFDLPPAGAVTLVCASYAVATTGIASLCGVKSEFERFIKLTADLLYFEGYLTDAQVEERLRALMGAASGMTMPTSLPSRRAHLVIGERGLAGLDASSVQKALDTAPVNFIMAKQLERFPGAHLVGAVAAPKTANGASAPIPEPTR